MQACTADLLGQHPMLLSDDVTSPADEHQCTKILVEQNDFVAGQWVTSLLCGLVVT